MLDTDWHFAPRIYARFTERLTNSRPLSNAKRLPFWTAPLALKLRLSCFLTWGLHDSGVLYSHPFVGGGFGADPASDKEGIISGSFLL